MTKNVHEKSPLLSTRFFWVLLECMGNLNIYSFVQTSFLSTTTCICFNDGVLISKIISSPIFWPEIWLESAETLEFWSELQESCSSFKPITKSLFRLRKKSPLCDFDYLFFYIRRGSYVLSLLLDNRASAMECYYVTKKHLTSLVTVLRDVAHI